MSKRISSFLIVGLAVLFSGCATREDIRGIQADLYNIQQGIEKHLGSVKDQTSDVQTAQADLLQQINLTGGDIRALQSDLNDYQQRLTQLSMRLDDLEASLTARMDTQIELLSGSKFVEKPLPSTIYNMANVDFVRGRWTEAVSGFQSYLKQFPKGDRAAEAHLKIGDALSKQKNFSGAVDSYNQLIVDFPKSPLLPTALLRKASSCESVGDKAQAKDIYAILIKSYLYAPESKIAQDRLRMLQSE